MRVEISPLAERDLEAIGAKDRLVATAS